MSRENEIINKLDHITAMVGAIFESLPPEKQAALKTQLLEDQYKKAIYFSNQGNHIPLQTFLKTNKTFLKTRNQQHSRQLEDTQIKKRAQL